MPSFLAISPTPPRGTKALIFIPVACIALLLLTFANTQLYNSNVKQFVSFVKRNDSKFQPGESSRKLNKFNTNSMAEKTQLGAKIFSLRKALGMTQGSLGAQVGVSRAAISQFELGENVPSNETRSKLSAALGFDLATVWSVKPEDNGFLSLPFYSIKEQPDLLHTIWDPNSDNKRGAEAITSIDQLSDNRVPVLRLPGISYKNSIVIEINGNKMGPRYPSGARYVVDILERKELDYATGVHLFVIDSAIFLSRIISNDDSRILVKTDATGEEISLDKSMLKKKWDLAYCQLFKLRQAVHMPAEE